METLEKIDKSLTECKIPTTVQDISEKVFSSYDSLESIECDSDYFKSIDGVLFTADYKTLVRYPPKKIDANYVIPDSVVNIGSYAFRNCEFLEHIILPDSLINIGESAFSRCKSLQDIILPDSITKICRDTFMLCQSLKKIKLPNSLTEIGNSAFMYCKALQEIDLPNTLSKIGSCIFSNCSSLRRINISVSLNYIPKYAFANCSKLKRITLPNSIKHIESGAFSRCNFLREIKLSKELIDIDSSAFSSCKLLNEIELPNGIESINDGAFWGCESLETISLPNSIQHIGNNTFGFCPSLEKIECDNEYYYTVDGVLFDKKDKKLVRYPQGRTERKYTIPNGILIIGQAAFGNCCDLEEIILPESVKILKSDAFHSCSKLKSIKLPNQISSIAPSAFFYCWDLKGIECDSPFFKSIDGVLFTADLKTLVCYPQGKGCDNYVVPDSVTNIAEDAFCSFVSPWTADSCKRITLPKSINEITDTTFEHHESLKWIECDNEHYKSIDGVLFTADCKTLVYYPRGREDSQYIIPDTVTKIENRAFASNSYLRKIIIPKGRMEDFIEMFPEDNEYELAEA